MAGSSQQVKEFVRSLFRALRDVESAARVSDELRQLNDLIERDTEALSFFRSPLFETSDKVALVRGLAERSEFDEWTEEVVVLIAEKELMGQFPHVAERLTRLLDDHLGRAMAEVRTAHELDDHQQEALREYLGQETGLDIQLDVQEDESLVGGFVAQVRDLVYDASLATQLDTMKEHLTAAGDY